ncbi:MAG: hypothetical protein QW767_01625 [Thermoprotei archaeon]
MGSSCSFKAKYGAFTAVKAGGAWAFRRRESYQKQRFGLSDHYMIHPFPLTWTQASTDCSKL